MTTQPVECKHPEDQQRWLSNCCGAGVIYEVLADEPLYPEDQLGFCTRCREMADFSLACLACRATVEATGEAT